MDENGVTGLGEASPLPGFSGENLEDSAGQLISLCSRLPGREIPKSQIEPNGAPEWEIEDTELTPSARFGIELALYNLHAANEGKSLPKMLYAAPMASVPVNGLLSGTLEEVLAGGRKMRGAGYGSVKLKVGGRGVEEAVEVVRSLREVLGEDVGLRLDANRAWSFAEAASFVRAVEATGYEYLEEPLADPSGLESLVRDHGAFVALDESLVGVEPEDLRRHGYVRAVVVKPTLVGGISQTLRLADEANRLGITPVVSSAYESGVGTGALVALAAATGGGKIPAGLDTYRRLGADVLHPPLDLTSPGISLDKTFNTGRELCQGYLSVLHSSGS